MKDVPGELKVYNLLKLDGFPTITYTYIVIDMDPPNLFVVAMHVGNTPRYN